MEITRQQIYDYYSREEIVSELIKNAAGREVAGAFFDGRYDARPNILQFPSDVLQSVRKGVTSFHYSVEHWQNPMAVHSDGDYSKMRTGWDVIIDIDSKLGIEESQISALEILDFLKRYGVKDIGVKFSGRRGFHLCLPWRMFPKEINYKPLAKLYPEAPRAVVSFIRESIREELMKKLLQKKSAKQMVEALQQPPSELSPYYFVEIENKWGARHMFRAPYSFNEKTWMVSVPISLSQLKNFSLEIAKPGNVEIKEAFFKGEENEAESLLLEALDWDAKQRKEEVKKEKPRRIDYERKIPEGLFPPCMHVILDGLQDGRKRALFTLISFLRMCNWTWSEIEQKVFEWNERNKPPLPRNTVLAQLRWGQANARNPWNCPPDGQMYVDIGVCRPDNICKAGTQHIAIKNPIVYPFKKMGKPRNKDKSYKRGYSCMHCDREFKSMQGLSAHKSRTHGIYD